MSTRLNQLSSLPESLDDVTVGNHLDLGDNELSSLPESEFARVGAYVRDEE